MGNGQQPQWITDEEIEQGFRANGWNFVTMGPQHWMLTFVSPGQVGGYQVHVENGQMNEGFVGVHIVLLHLASSQAQRSMDCLCKALSLMNGHLGIVKFDLHGETVVARTAFLRLRAVFPPEKLRQTLRHAIGAVLAGAEFARPILECCIQEDGCDVEEEVRRRMAELGLERPDFGGLAPPPEG